MAINFGGHIFSEPEPIIFWEPPNRAGIYAIMTFDPMARPRPFRVIYFGESGNLSERGFLRSHHRYLCWLTQSGSENNLYISVYLMPNSAPQQRRIIESLLINEYKPSCNY